MFFLLFFLFFPSYFFLSSPPYPFPRAPPARPVSSSPPSPPRRPPRAPPARAPSAAAPLHRAALLHAAGRLGRALPPPLLAAPTPPRAVPPPPSAARAPPSSEGHSGRRGTEPLGATKTWLRLPYGSRWRLQVRLLVWSSSKNGRLVGLRTEPLVEPCQTGPEWGAAQVE